MAWIESHTEVERHRKTILMAAELSMKPVHLSGHLHALWHNALEQQEDGDLSKWPPELVAQMSMFEGDPGLWISLLKKHGWIDADTMLLHDWLDYAGDFLLFKYRRRHRERLRHIWLKYGKRYGKRMGQIRAPVPQMSHTTNPVVGLVGMVGNTSPSLEKEGESRGEEKTKPLPDWLDPEVWESYRQHRAAMPKKYHMTPHAEELALKQLAKWHEQGQDVNEIIRRAVISGWVGLYEIKTGGDHGKRTDNAEPKGLAGLRDWHSRKTERG